VEGSKGRRRIEGMTIVRYQKVVVGFVAGEFVVQQGMERYNEDVLGYSKVEDGPKVQ